MEVLHQALRDAEIANVDTGAIQRALGIEQEAEDAQKAMALRTALAAGKFVKRGHDLHARHEAEAQLRAAVAVARQALDESFRAPDDAEVAFARQ
eukprot:5130725-Prymnesium_polylepis.1